MRWETYEMWWTLHARDWGRLARLYHPHYMAKWTVRLIADFEPDEIISLDPTLTEEEAKLVVQTLTGGQL